MSLVVNHSNHVAAVVVAGAVVAVVALMNDWNCFHKSKMFKGRRKRWKNEKEMIK